MLIYVHFAVVCAFFAGTGIALLWRYLKYHFRYWERRRIPHMIPSIPTGNMQKWMRSKHYAEIFAETYTNYKDRGLLFAGFYFNMQKAVIVMDLKLVRAVLTQNFFSFQRRGLFHNERDDPLTGNLFLLDGPKWKWLRSKLAPTFAESKVKYIFPTVLSVGVELHKAFTDKIGQTRNGVFDVTYVLSRFSCDVIGNCVFGLECQSMTDPNTPLLVMARKFFSQRRHLSIVDSLINCFPEWAKFLRMKIIPQSVTDFYLKTVRDTILYREHNGIKKPDYLDLLIELKNKTSKNTKQFGMEELAAQAFSFFITAFDTCSSVISCALYELARHPHVQKKLRQEIKKTLKSHKKELTYECLSDMKYLDQVISETLRKYPASPALFRKCTETFVPFNRSHYRIEKGCMVIIPILSMHYDTKYFSNPFDFDPDRFSPANISKIQPCSYLPFGEGQRACIGLRFGRMQISIGLLKLIKNFKFEVCDETKIPLKLVTPAFSLTPTSVTLKVTKL